MDDLLKYLQVIFWSVGIVAGTTTACKNIQDLKKTKKRPSSKKKTGRKSK